MAKDEKSVFRMVTNYKRGYEAELKAKKELEDGGYHVTRASGSHSLFDIIAVNGKLVRFIQLKRTKGRTPSFKEEMRVLSSVPVPKENATVELWIWEDCIRSGKARKAGWRKELVQ